MIKYQKNHNQTRLKYITFKHKISKHAFFMIRYEMLYYVMFINSPVAVVGKLVQKWERDSYTQREKQHTKQYKKQHTKQYTKQHTKQHTKQYTKQYTKPHKSIKYEYTK